jgi:hypothetical protein
MAQWNKSSQDYLNQERTLFEVYMRADKYGNVYDDLGQGFSGDLFGRLKVSNPYTLFDDTHRYANDGQFSDVVIGTGSTIGIVTAQSTAFLGIGTTAGCSIIRESKRVFSYQPGKSLQVLQTFVLNPAKSNLVQRVGYGSSENGIFLELNNFQTNIVKRTSISGVTTTVSIPQNQWNFDTLDGTGPSTSNPSGLNLDLTKAQILFTEYEWLGVGCVRVGFANSNGKFHIAHIFNHANILDSVYITTATLPVRYEILNTADVGTASTMKQICVSVQSNGGYEKKVIETIAKRGAAITGIGQSYFPIVSIKLAPGREDAIVIPSQFTALPLSNNINYEIVLIKNATLVGAAFSVSDSNNVHYDTSASGLSGGKVVNIKYITGSNQSGGAISVDQQYNWDMQLGRTQSKVSDIYTLAARTISGSGDVIGSLSFYDLT